MEETTAYLKKSGESLASAKDDLANKRYNSCANRAYYACYQVAVALLTKQGIDPTGKKEMWKHEAVQAQTAKLIKRKKIIPAKHRKTLSKLMITRLTADYRPRNITKKEADSSLKIATDFVRLVTKEVSR